MTPPKPHPWLRVAALTLLLVVLSPLLVRAHTDTQLSEWLDQWELQLADQFDGRGADSEALATLWDEHVDMATRHPCRKVIDTWSPHCVKPAVHSEFRGMGSDVEQWRGLVSAYFPASQVNRALCIMAHESGGNPYAKNPNSSASGLFQHLARYWPDRSSAAGWGGASIWDPEANIAVAAWLWWSGGWTHWSPYNRGLCR